MALFPTLLRLVQVVSYTGMMMWQHIVVRLALDSVVQCSGCVVVMVTALWECGMEQNQLVKVRRYILRTVLLYVSLVYKLWLIEN